MGGGLCEWRGRYTSSGGDVQNCTGVSSTRPLEAWPPLPLPLLMLLFSLLWARDEVEEDEEDDDDELVVGVAWWAWPL